MTIRKETNKEKELWGILNIPQNTFDIDLTDIAEAYKEALIRGLSGLDPEELKMGDEE